jgi:hypothetical protein
MNRGRSFGVVMTKTAVRTCAGILLLSLCGVSQAQPKPQKIVIQYPATASIGGVLPWIAIERNQADEPFSAACKEQ